MLLDLIHWHCCSLFLTNIFRSEKELGLSLQYWEECFSLSSDEVPTCLQPIAEKVGPLSVYVCRYVLSLLGLMRLFFFNV